MQRLPGNMHLDSVNHLEWRIAMERIPLDCDSQCHLLKYLSFFVDSEVFLLIVYLVEMFALTSVSTLKLRGAQMYEPWLKSNN